MSQLQEKIRYFESIQRAKFDTRINLNNQARSYRSVVFTTTKINGVQDTRYSPNIVKIMARYQHNTSLAIPLSDDVPIDCVRDANTEKIKEKPAKKGKNKKILKKSEEGVPLALGDWSELMGVAQPVRATEDLVANWVTKAAEVTKSCGDFQTFDHSALVARLMCGIANFSLCGKLSIKDLSAGLPLNIISMHNASGPLGASERTVFFPSAIDDLTSPYVLTAITAAFASFGSSVVTDRVLIDEDDNAILPGAENDELVQGCLHALRILGSLYYRSGAGGIFSLALAVGISEAITVVGQTDEAGYFRTVLRNIKFVPSRGGILASERSWVAFPEVPLGHHAALVGLVDSIALTVYASIAVADPCVLMNGEHYPTVVTCRRVGVSPSQSGLNVSGTNEDGASIAARLRVVAKQFYAPYIKVLTKNFGLYNLANSDEFVKRNLCANGALESGFMSDAVSNDRHLRYPSVAPFYFIEPTGIIKLKFEDLPAVIGGHAHLCLPDETVEIDLFPGYELVGSESDLTAFKFKYTNGRKCGAVLHLYGHNEDGLANVRPYVCDDGLFVHVGGQSASITDRKNAMHTMDKYLWARVENRYPAPSECLYLGTGIEVVARHMTLDPVTWQADITHFPSRDELAGVITLQADRYVSLGVHDLGTVNYAVNRAYTAAVQSLANASQRMPLYVSTTLGMVQNRDAYSAVSSVQNNKNGLNTLMNDVSEQNIASRVVSSIRNMFNRDVDKVVQPIVGERTEVVREMHSEKGPKIAREQLPSSTIVHPGKEEVENTGAHEMESVDTSGGQ